MLAGTDAVVRLAVAQLAADGPGLSGAEDGWRHRLLAQACAAVQQAGAEGCDVVVLPEYCSGWLPQLTAELAEPESGELVSGLRSAAAQAGIVVVAGVLVPAATHDRALNVTLVIGADGEVLGRYPKVHLYDAYGARESELLDAGEPGRPLVVDVPVAGGSLRLGVVTCYDLRFPESIRALADCADGDAPVDVVAVGAAWSGGEHKADQVRTLVRTRAIENTAYLALASQSGRGRVGGSVVVDPRGVVAAAVDDGADRGSRVGADGEPVLAVATISGETLTRVREASPVLAHRRYRVRPA